MVEKRFKLQRQDLNPDPFQSPRLGLCVNSGVVLPATLSPPDSERLSLTPSAHLSEPEMQVSEPLLFIVGIYQEDKK